MRKRILLLSPQNVIPATDGGKIGIYKPMQMLAREHEVKAMIFCDENEQPVAENYKKINVDVIAAPVNKQDSLAAGITNIANKLPFKFAKYYKKEHKALIEKICADWQPGIIICHHAHLAEYCHGLKKKFPLIQFILREHNVEYLLVEQYYGHQKNVLLKQFAYWQYKKTKRYEVNCWGYFDKVVFISDSDFKSFTPQSKTKGYIIYDGTDVKPLISVSNDEKANAFLFSGSLKSYQNKINLTHFIKNIWIPWKKTNTRADSYALWLTGDRDKNFVTGELALNDNELADYKINILGFVEDIEAVMRSARFFLSPTIIGAGIRIKVLQAMGLGCVTFLTQKDLDISSKFIDGKNVLLYNNLETFNSKFEAVLAGNGLLYNNIAKQAAITAEQNFTWDIFYKKLKALF